MVLFFSYSHAVVYTGQYTGDASQLPRCLGRLCQAFGLGQIRIVARYRRITKSISSAWLTRLFLAITSRLLLLSLRHLFRHLPVVAKSHDSGLPATDAAASQLRRSATDSATPSTTGHRQAVHLRKETTFKKQTL